MLPLTQPTIESAISDDCPIAVADLLRKWEVRTGTTVALRDDGHWVAANASRQMAWALNAVMARLVALIQNMPQKTGGPGAWSGLIQAMAQAGAFAPTQDGGIPHDALVELVQDLPSILQDLGDLGILTPRDPAIAVRPSPPGSGRILFAVSPPARKFREPVVVVGRWFPLPLWLTAVFAGSRLWASGQLQILWEEWLRFGSMPGRVVGTLLAIVAIYMAHELGHAWVLASATGKSVGIGIRRTMGIPHPYTNTTDLAVLPTRSLRLSVLLAGATAEGFLWLIAWLLLGRINNTVSMVVVPMVLASGPLAMLASLWPYWGTDGYYALSDMTLSSGVRATLAERSQIALGRMLVANQDNPTEQPDQAIQSSTPHPMPRDLATFEILPERRAKVLDGIPVETSFDEASDEDSDHDAPNDTSNEVASKTSMGQALDEDSDTLSSPSHHVSGEMSEEPSDEVSVETMGPRTKPRTPQSTGNLLPLSETPPSWLTWYALFGTLALSILGGLLAMSVGILIKRPDVGGVGAILAATAIAVDRGLKGVAAFKKEQKAHQAQAA